MSPAEDQFVSHWHDRIAGMALRGLVLDSDTRPLGPYSAGQAALGVPERTERLIRQMFADARKILAAEAEAAKALELKTPKPAAPPNGVAPTQRRPT